jgi:hypothetical protein
MIGLLCFVLAVLASPFKSKLRLEAENAVLRHQLNVVRRRLPGRVRLTNNDRWFFIQARSAAGRPLVQDRGVFFVVELGDLEIGRQGDLQHVDLLIRRPDRLRVGAA